MAKILVIDDSKFMRDRITNALHQSGHEVLEAIDGAVGLEMIAIQSFDCVLLDLNMPVIDGFEFLSRLRAGGSPLPVIVLTADIQTGTRTLCENLGVSAFLPKPPRGEELCASVELALTGARGGFECV